MWQKRVGMVHTWYLWWMRWGAQGKHTEGVRGLLLCLAWLLLLQWRHIVCGFWYWKEEENTERWIISTESFYAQLTLDFVKRFSLSSSHLKFGTALKGRWHSRDRDWLHFRDEEHEAQGSCDGTRVKQPRGLSLGFLVCTLMREHTPSWLANTVPFAARQQHIMMMMTMMVMM